MILDKFKELEDQSHLKYESNRKTAGMLISLGSALLVWKIAEILSRK
jgi:hypothetical protein